MSKTNYQRKLSDPQWQRRRLEIMQRDGFKCTCCAADKKELHVHHKYYLRGKEIWDYPDHALITLCHECHEYKEGRLKTGLEDLGKSFRLHGGEAFMYSVIINVFEKCDPANLELYTLLEVMNFAQQLEKRGVNVLQHLDKLIKELDSNDRG